MPPKQLNTYISAVLQVAPFFCSVPQFPVAVSHDFLKALSIAQAKVISDTKCDKARNSRESMPDFLMGYLIRQVNRCTVREKVVQLN